MSVNVNTVYQRVLAITTKEQRGYITPQEFNYMANQAQLDIFEQYFYDLNQFARIPGNSTEYSDMLDILEEKISLFEKNGTVTSGTTLPADLYRLGTVMYNNIEAEHITQKDWIYLKKSPLSQPSNDFPVYIRDKDGIKVYADSLTSNETSNVTCNYVRIPGYQTDAVSWAGDSTTGLYNSNASKNFELHESEETELVIKILAMTGIVLKDPGLYQIGSTEDAKNVQQEKA